MPALEGAPKEPRPQSHRLPFPDNVVKSIFEHVATRHWDVDDLGSTPPVKYLRVNKQLYALLKPLWYSHIEGPSSASGTDATDSSDYYSSLILKGVADHVRSLVVRLQPRDCLARTVFALVASCRSLETIRLVDRVCGSSDGGKKKRQKDDSTLPEFVLEACSALPNLKCLDFSHDYSLPDWPLPPLPKLKSIEILGASLRPRMAQYLETLGVQRLFLLIEEPAELATLPWSTLDALTLSFGNELEVNSMAAAIVSLEEQVKDLPQDLRRLTSFTLHSHVAEPDCFLDRYTFMTLLPLKSLEISLHDQSADLDYPSLGWTSLRELKITANVKLSKDEHLRSLLDFLHRLPHLRRLELDSYKIISDKKTLAEFEGNRYAELAPFLAAFLTSLRFTSVLEFCSRNFFDEQIRSFGYYDGKAMPVFRCVRANRDQDFTRELWWSIEEIA